MGEHSLAMLRRGCLLLAAVAVMAQGAKFEFTDTELQPLMQIARRHAMFVKADAPSTSAPGNGDSYIDIKVEFKLGPDSVEAGEVQVIFFHHDEMDNVHGSDAAGNFCCTTKTEEGFGCKNGVDGKFVSTYTPLYTKALAVAPNDQPLKLEERVQVEKTGIHYLMYSSCRSTPSTILITGHNAWMNPYGYLPGDSYYNLPFFAAMAVLYLLIVALWFSLVCWHRSDGVLPVQYHIGAVAVLGLVEVVAWFMMYAMYNSDGARPVPLMTAAVVFSTIKKTTTRILILVVCMGYGIVKPTLGDSAKKVMVFGLLYTVFTTCLDVVKALSHDDDISGGFFILVIVPVALLDSIFYYWTFVSLYDVVAGLEERKQTIKLQLYRKFLGAVAICLVFSLGWVLFQMYFLYTEQYKLNWEYKWVFDAYWYALSFVGLVCIMVLWRPSSNSMSYAYHEQISSVDDNFEGIELEDPGTAFSIGDDEDEDQFDNENKDLAALEFTSDAPKNFKMAEV